MEHFDLIVIGTGPAGYTAAIYAARYNLDVMVIGEMPGGMLSEAYEVCNFPSYQHVNGMKLMEKMEEHVKSLDVPVNVGRVESVTGTDLEFKVTTSRSNYSTKKVIFATGTERRKLGLEREKKFLGRGVSYCATCDAAFFNEKQVGVVGGGDAALASSLLLSDHAENVYIIYRKDEFFRPEPIRVKEIQTQKNIKSIFESEVIELLGDKKLEKVKIRYNDGKEELLPLDGLFIEIGSTPNSRIAKNLGVSTTDGGYIQTDRERRTNVPGIYAAGDVIDSTLKQAITAAGQGAEAASTVYEDIKRAEVTD